MNERIKELATQARIQMCSDERLQEFAELIIRECASLTLDYAGPDHYTGWLDYRDEILKHFGVEE